MNTTSATTQPAGKHPLPPTEMSAGLAPKDGTVLRGTRAAERWAPVLEGRREALRMVGQQGLGAPGHNGLDRKTPPRERHTPRVLPEWPIGHPGRPPMAYKHVWQSARGAYTHVSQVGYLSTPPLWPAINNMGFNRLNWP